jgi:hypothetical protein
MFMYLIIKENVRFRPAIIKSFGFLRFVRDLVFQIVLDISETGSISVQRCEWKVDSWVLMTKDFTVVSNEPKWLHVSVPDRSYYGCL